MRTLLTNVQGGSIIRIARAMRSGSDAGLGDAGVERYEMADEITLAGVKHDGRIGKWYGNRHDVEEHAGNAAYAAAL